MTFRQGWFSLAGCCMFLAPIAVRAQVTVPEAPPAAAKPQAFHDGHFGVHFEVPSGWALARRDREVSSFHLDARSAPVNAQMRSVAAIQFNPYPYSTFSGALFYFSVEAHTTELECEAQATRPGPSVPATAEEAEDLQDIGGMSFAHGHDEHGKICVEARDEVYTAYRKGACYRFDLTLNTFCSISSGAADMTQAELQQIDQRMANILSTVRLDWEKTGPHPVPAPKVPVAPHVVPDGMHSASLRGGTDALGGRGLSGAPRIVERRRMPEAASGS